MEQKFFGIIAGKRLGGKTTLAGTLPSKTLMLQAEVYESGAISASRLAKKNGNELVVRSFDSLRSLDDYIAKLKDDESYENVYVDGFSAMTEMKSREFDYVELAKRNVWDAFSLLGQQIGDTLIALKKLSYPNYAKKPKNIFVTTALRVKVDSNGHQDVELEGVGRVAVTSVTKLGDHVLTIVNDTNEDGSTTRKLITKSRGVWPGRLSGVLDDDNPGVLPPDLSKIFPVVYPESY